MADTLDRINALRIVQGLEPLTELPKEEGEGAENGATDAPALVDDTAPAQDGAPAAPQAVADAPEIENAALDSNDNIPAPVDAELDESAILAILAKKGIAVESLAELAPKVDPEKEREKRESEKLAFALSKGIITRKEYEDFVRDSKDPKQVIYAQFYEDVKKEKPELTDEEIRDEFLEAYGLSADPDSLKFKKATQALVVLADKALREKYNKIYQIDSEYENYTSSEREKAEKVKKIQELAPKYKSDVESVISELRKFEAPISENEKYEIEFSSDALNAVKSMLTGSEYAGSKILDNWSKEEIKNVAYAALVTANLNDIIKNVVNQALLAKQSGTRGVPLAGGPATGATDRFAGMTEAQRKAAELIAPEYIKAN